ncbi:MAG: LysR substrate-binding domain-containing protein [Haliangiales bacterium]
MDWDDVRHFLALARAGSVRAAGAALDVSHSTVARRVDALEARLATRLFHRHSTGFVLTEAGHQMVPSAERIEHELAALERGLAGRDERLVGPVSITCTDHLIATIVLSGLAPLIADHPDIEVALTVDPRPFDLGRREADIAIRSQARGSQLPGWLVGQLAVPIVLASYIAVAHQGSLDPEQDGTRPRWLGYEDRELQRTLIASSSYPDLPIWGSFATLELALEAARAGLGLAVLPTYVGDPDPAMRRLTKPDLTHFADLWVVSHPDLRDTARFKAVRQQLVATLRARRGLFEGQQPR